MRWLFLFVLSLNLAYIAWEMNKVPSDNYAGVAKLKNVDTIVLLSELKQQQAARIESERQQTEAGSERDVSDTGVEEVADSHAVPERASVSQAAGAEDTAETVPPAVPETAATALSDSTAQTDGAADSLDTEVVVETPPVKPVPAAGCYTLGPFRDLDKLRGLTRGIKSYVVKADFRGQQEKEPTLYWVYLAPEKNRKQAIATGSRLKAKKIKDFYVIRDGEKENGISLGYFRNKNGAYALAKKVTDLDFKVHVEPVVKTYMVYWLDYQLAEGAVIPETIFEEYTGKGDKDKISHLEQDCGV